MFLTTIYDVSKRAGVSAATVSRVLNGNAQVAPELQHRVQEAIAALNFVPNGIARSLKTKRTERVALILPDITNPFFPELARGAQDACEARGYHLILSNTDDNPEREVRYLRMLVKVGVDGVIIIPAARVLERRAPSPTPLEPELVALGVPVVGISVIQVTQDADHIRVDEELTGYRAMAHLLDLGHTRIAVLRGADSSSVSELRLSGAHRAARERGVSLRPDWVIDGHAKREGGFAAMRQLLDGVDRPSAVFAINDIMALGALAAAHEARLDIPGDLAVVGVDNIAEAATAFPPLSTVALPSNYEQGFTAAQLLLERIHAPQSLTARRTVMFETHLIIRGSTVALVP